MSKNVTIKTKKKWKYEIKCEIHKYNILSQIMTLKQPVILCNHFDFLFHCFYFLSLNFDLVIFSTFHLLNMTKYVIIWTFQQKLWFIIVWFFFSDEVEMGDIRDSFTNSSVIYLVTISSTEWKINPWEEPCWRSNEQT